MNVQRFKQQIEEILNIQVKDLSLFEEAFTHPSYVNDHPGVSLTHYERLEFLGDAAIELAVSDHLYRYFPDEPEGQLTKWRASIVRAESLAEAMSQTGLIKFVRLGKGEDQLRARQRVSLLCDVFEAMIGAVYIEKDLKHVNQILDMFLYPLIQSNQLTNTRDFKSHLQEELQKKGQVTITYSIIDEKGPDHQKEFWSEVRVDGHILGKGYGTSRKRAEQSAAQNALENLQRS